jgi:hypothetical protein
MIRHGGLSRTRPRAASVLLVLLVCAWTGAEASDQRRSVDERPASDYEASWPTVEFGIGALWLGGTPLGERDATLTPNQIPATGRFVLFRTSTSLEPVVGLEARLGYRFSQLVGMEASLAVSRPQLRTAITGDVEAPDRTTFTLDGSMTQYFIEGSAVIHLRRLRFAGGRGMPFASGGVGYLRQLHRDNVLVETGRLYHAGGG